VKRGKPRAIELDPEIRETIEQVSARLLEQGAKATLLTGSHARGEARPESDIDVFAVGDGPREHIEIVDGRAISVHWFAPEQARQRIQSPPHAIVSVAGWADAVVVDDPVGVGAELQREARAWSWERIEAEADAFAVDELVGWAEWVHKLIAALQSERMLDAAAITNDTALRLGRVVAIRCRVSARSENGLWEAIVKTAPLDCGEALREALRGDDEDLRTAARGAFRLFQCVARDVAELLDERESAIVDHARSAADAWC